MNAGDESWSTAIKIAVNLYLDIINLFAVNLYLDIINLFLDLLQILAESGGN